MKEKRMRCLVDRFFWCPIFDNEDGQYCHMCHFDPQLERINLMRKRRGLNPIRLPTILEEVERK